jgi:hypothetical protein
MIDEDVIVLQIHTSSVMDELDPCGEPNATSCDASQTINIKVEDVSGAEEEKSPVQITFPKIKVEPEVRCMSLYVYSKKESCPCTKSWRSVGL